jgi:AraC family transcriptional activator of pyochelin receptor
MRYVLDATDLELSLEPCGPGAASGRVHEFRATMLHPCLRISAHVLELDGVVIVRGRHDASRALVLHGDDDAPQLVFHAGLRGHPTAQVEGLGFLSHQPHTTDLAYTPGTRTTFTVDAGASNEAFEVNFTLPAVLEWARRYPEMLDPIADRVVRGEPFRDTRTAALAPQQLIGAADAIMASARLGLLQAAFVEASIVELLVRHLGAPRLDGTPAPRVHDVERVMEARDRLLGRLADPPTIPELARAVGTNAFRLKRDFKAVLGESVGAFVVSRRLEHARALILESARPIKAIAADAGYSDVAHFSNAFKRRYGVPPSDLRPSRRRRR